jgi:hypothetical protein
MHMASIQENAEASSASMNLFELSSSANVTDELKLSSSVR